MEQIRYINSKVKDKIGAMHCIIEEMDEELDLDAVIKLQKQLLKTFEQLAIETLELETKGELNNE